MPIISSERKTYPQPDGWSHVTETHTDSTGKQWTWFFVAGPTTDLNASMAQHAIELSERLAALEFEQQVGG